jgi:hypothetical protein
MTDKDEDRKDIQQEIERGDREHSKPKEPKMGGWLFWCTSHGPHKEYDCPVCGRNEGND